MAPAAAASKSFVLSAMLLFFARGSLVFAGSGDALKLQLLQLCLCLFGAIPLRKCALYKKTLRLDIQQVARATCPLFSV